ncbi:hypothetical protein NADFUDRAFT_50704 [Nadsonia fulvescens var. elongata DSM 6958]|uniref:ubiquitinyl hydrolase 1 n=1 Tax=Nadsonia fulvescens var. elongata DSM 6958 TaxID=857566 RepID=A0A1E3PMZ5_9ASCO|nr:hypothetical protein NADFUDRAFT_50704 [Nadsonia fulvescens var. elongata DSM 6958]
MDSFHGVQSMDVDPKLDYDSPSVINNDQLSDAGTLAELEERADNLQFMKQKAFSSFATTNDGLSEGLEVDEESTFTWEIKDWQSLEKKTHGPRFTFHNYNWDILLFPHGNNSPSVSLYLNASPADSKSSSPESSVEIGMDAGAGEVENVPLKTNEAEQDWAVCAQFSLVMWNPDDPSIYQVSSAQHRFNNSETDWGFTNFYDIRRLAERHLDSSGALLENNKVNISAFIRVIKDPTGVLWHNFINYDSKKVTGYIGIKNQGATCYLNSLLQSLYFTNQFRKVVYQIPTETETPNESVVLALQRCFYTLQTANYPLDTLELTRSFGWDSGDAFTQHDVQELLRVLMDSLETRMKTTAVEGALSDIFVGEMKSYIKCVNVDFESSRKEEYWDIQLNVKGMKNVEDSFKDYIQVEMLEGENQYQATGFGLQDAKKGVVFQSFPPVLHLQLKRYEYDFQRDMMVKNNDRYEFPQEIDFSPFLDETSTIKDENWEYALHGVLVHSGDLNAGHYYALLKPQKDGDWYKFDDDRVTKATLKEVLDDNYGSGNGNNGDLLSGGFGRTMNLRQMRLQIKRHTSAYMLVYIRKNKLDTVLSPVVESDVPSYIPQQLAEELAEEQRRRKEREEQHLYTYIKVTSDRQIQRHHSFDIANWDIKHAREADEEGAKPRTLRVKKSLKLKELMKVIADDYGIDNIESFRLWTCCSRQNRTVRPDIPLDPNHEQIVEEIMEASSKANILRFWIEEASYDQNGVQIPWKIGYGDSSITTPEQVLNQEPSLQDQSNLQLQPTTKDSNILIFAKYFDPFKQSLEYIGHFVVDKNSFVEILKPLVCKKLGWVASSTMINVFEEVKPMMISPIGPKTTFDIAELGNGDIICFQKVYPKEEMAHVKGYRDAVSFYSFLLNRVKISFFSYKAFRKANEEPANGEIKPDTESESKLEDGNNTSITNNDDDDEDEFEFWISKKDTFDQLVEKVSEYINAKPTHIRLYCQGLNGSIRIIRKTNDVLKNILSSCYADNLSTVMYYEKLDMSLAELEALRPTRVSWLTQGVMEDTKVDLLVPRNGTYGELLNILRMKLGIADKVSNLEIKLWTSSSNIQKIKDMPVHNAPIDNHAGHFYATLKTADELSFEKQMEALQSNVLNPDLVSLDDEPEQLLEEETFRYIQVFHFQKDTHRTHGIPIPFLLIKGEKFLDTKKRLQNALGFPDVLYSKTKFAAIRGADPHSKPVYFETNNDKTISSAPGVQDSQSSDNLELFRELNDEDSIGLDHFDRTPVKHGYSERAIFIKH